MIGLYTKNFEGVWFGVACDDKKIFATSFSSSQINVLHGLLANIPFNVPFQQPAEFSSFAEQALALMKDVYDGKGAGQTLPLSMEHLSNYAERVLEAVALIPVGYVSSYGAVAKAVGGSPRAVGRVMATNPFPPLVPCHRVVASDFSLGGYSGGLRAKLEFLKREKRGFIEKMEIPAKKKRLQVYPVEYVLNK